MWTNLYKSAMKDNNKLRVKVDYSVLSTGLRDDSKVTVVMGGKLMAGELNKRLFYEKNIYETMTPGADIFSLPVARSLLSGASD